MRTAKLGLVFLLALALTGSAQTPGEVTVAGFVADTWCGRKGANALHAEHARRAVASGLAQYALYDEASKKLYILLPQSTAEQYAGQRVQITGTLGPGPAGLRHAGQTYAPDAVAAYKDPSAPGGLRATGASGSSVGAVSGQAKLQSHENALDQTTPIAGVLTITSVEAAPPPPPVRRTTKPR